MGIWRELYSTSPIPLYTRGAPCVTVCDVKRGEIITPHHQDDPEGLCAADRVQVIPGAHLSPTCPPSPPPPPPHQRPYIRETMHSALNL